MKLSVNVLHERYAATSVIPRTTRETLRKFAFAVDHCGAAHHATFVNTWHLKRVKNWKHERVNTDGGWFKITIPWSRPGWDSLAVAQQFFEVGMHEWRYIADYQAGGRWSLPWASRGPGGRRARHDSRPEELRAINAVDEAIAEGAVTRYQDLIIALAIEHETNHG